jgi:WD40 repeat protein
VSFSPDNAFIAYGSEDDNVYVHDVGGSFPLNSTLSQAGDRVRGGPSFSPDNSLLAYGDDNGDVFVHDVGGGFPLNTTLTASNAGFVKGLEFSNLGNFLAYTTTNFSNTNEIVVHEVPGFAVADRLTAATNNTFSRLSFNSPS